MASVNLMLPALVTIITCSFNGIRGNDASTTCDVYVPCDCCLSDQCNSDQWCTGYNGACKDGYWGAKCIIQCPELCVSCHRKFPNEQTCFECKAGYYNLNNNCSSICPRTCKEGVCDNDGFCAKCEQGYFGIKTCNMTCHKNCLNNVCEMQNGGCLACIDGQYGEYRCEYKCPQTCYNGSCERETGQCFNCDKTHFGDHCEHTCSKGCEIGVGVSICDKQNGTCLHGCRSSYHGVRCIKASTTDVNVTATVIGVSVCVMALIIGLVIGVILLARKRKLSDGNNAPDKTYDDLQNELRSTNATSTYDTILVNNSVNRENPSYVNTAFPMTSES